jgi:hypothetical protein
MTGGPDAWVAGWMFSGGGSSVVIQANIIDLHGIPSGVIGIRVQQIGSGTQKTHYGPAGHEADAGKELRFQVQVIEDINAPATICGVMAAAQFPRPGPIPNVRMNWNTGGLDKYGEVRYEPASGFSGSDGMATLIFTPKNEVIPGFGSEIDRPGVLLATPDFSTASPGTFNLAGVPLTMPWEVSFHKPRGFKFSNTNVHWHGANSGGTWDINFALSGSVCGDTPYAQWLFDLVFSIVVTGNGFGTEHFAPVPGKVPVTLSPDSSVLLIDGVPEWPVQIDFVPSTSPAVRFTVGEFAPGSGSLPTPPVVMAPVEEDLSCPDNSTSG